MSSSSSNPSSDSGLTLDIVPAPDAAFTIQAINEQYNSFYRAVATSLFYVRTGINLGFGAAPIDEERAINPLELHRTPNHFVQECLANWLEFYVGRYLLGSQVTGEGIDKDVLKGDFTRFENDGKTYPPLSSLMDFLEDWYACACIQFVRGDLSKDDHRRLHRFLSPYSETISLFISPANAETAYTRAGEVSVSMRVQILNEVLEAEFPPRKVSKSFCPQVVLLTGATGSDLYSHSCFTSVAQGTNLVPLPPDLHSYDPSDKASFTYPKTVRLYESTFDLEDLFQPDRIFLLESTFKNDDAVETAFDCLFGLIGMAPSFAHRGYMRRVTERVLAEHLPSMSEAHLMGIVHHLYPGDKVQDSRSLHSKESYGPPILPRAITISQKGLASNQEKAHIVLSFTSSAWEELATVLHPLLTFFQSHRIVLENGRDLFVASPTKEGRWRSSLRLYETDGDRYGCEKTSHVLTGTVEDLSKTPMLSLFVSGANAASLALRGDKTVARSFETLASLALPSFELNRVFGSRSIFNHLMAHRSHVNLHGESLESPCVTYGLFREEDWFSHAEDLSIVDHHTRYVPAVKVPVEVDGRDNEQINEWFLGRRDLDAEDGDRVCLIAPRPIESDRDAFVLGEPVTDGVVVYPKEDISCASSSLQKGIVFNFLHLTLLQAMGDDGCQRALSALLDRSTPLRYASKDLAERHASDLSDLRAVL